MDVKCEKCAARYRIDDARVTAAGLTMRCGKCGSTFKVTKGGATQSVTPGAPPAATKPAPAAPAANPEQPANATMMFAAPVRPAVAPGKTAPPAAKPAPVKPPASEGAGATMMFGVAPVLPAKPPPAVVRPPPAAKPAPAADESGSTMMFAASPVVAAKTDAAAAAKAAAAARAPAPPSTASEDSGSTMMFAGGPPVQPVKPPPVAPPPRAPEPPAAQPEPVEQAAAEAEQPASAGHEAPDEAVESEASTPQRNEPIAPMARDAPQEDSGGIIAEGAESGEHTQSESLVPQPRKVPVVPIVIAASLIVVAALGLIAFKRFSKQLPQPAAVEQMSDAHKSALKDTIADYASAEAQANQALAINRRAFFPSGWAELAEIEIGWADVLKDTSAPDAEIKARRAAATDAINQGFKQEAQNLDLIIAQADYYRSVNSSSNYAKAMKKASTLGASDARVSFVQGAFALAEDEASDKAAPLLKSAAEALKDSARVRFRYAQSLAATKQHEAAIKELSEVLKLSPAHDRAKALLEQEKAQVAPPPAPPPEEKKK